DGALPDFEKGIEAGNASALPASLVSEHNLQPKLNLPRNTNDAGNRTCRTRTDRRIGQVELRSIKDVEKLGSELDLDLFGNREVLEQGEVKVYAAGAVEYVAPGIPVLKLRWLNESSRIEPAAGTGVVNGAIGHAIRPAGCVYSRTCQSRCVGQASLKRGNSVYLPTTQNGVGYRIIVHMCFPLAERELVVRTVGKALPNVKA